MLLWKHNMRIEYVAVAPWPLEPEGPRGTRVEVTMEGAFSISSVVSGVVILLAINPNPLKITQACAKL